MTEIEKQAEEYINSIPSTSGECKGSVYSEEKLKQAYKDGWLSRDGAEHRKGRWFVTPDYEIECVGLNSCAGFVNPLFVGNYKIDCIEFIKKEIDGSKSKWHDLRENPNDFPNDDRDVVNERGMIVWCKDGIWYESGVVMKIRTYPIAWCELPKFKE